MSDENENEGTDASHDDAAFAEFELEFSQRILTATDDLRRCGMFVASDEVRDTLELLRVRCEEIRRPTLLARLERLVAERNASAEQFHQANEVLERACEDLGLEFPVTGDEPLAIPSTWEEDN